MRFASCVAFALSLGLAAPMASAQREGGPVDPIAQFKAEVALHLGQLKLALGALDEDLDAELEDLVTATLLGYTHFPAFLEALTDLVVDAELRSFLAADSEVQAIEQLTSSAVGSGNTPPLVLMPGACAEIEKFAKKLQGRLAKHDAAFLKDVKKAIARVESALDLKVNLVQAPTKAPAPPAPGPGSAPEPPPLPKPVAITGLGAGSDVSLADDGILCAGGTADPTLNGGIVDVVIVGPTGTQTTTVPVNPSSCRWRACFTGLREGNYAVSAHQGGAATTGRIGVPGAPID